MSLRWIFFLGGIGLACQGCTPLSHVARTLIVEPTHYPRRLDDLEDEHVNNTLAKDAWHDFQANHEGISYSEHFARGFRAGFADYLYAGGSGTPPPVPPRYYWRSEFENPQGHEAIRDWFAGFRQGAESAKLSGYRELVTLPSSLKEPLSSAEQQPLEMTPPAEELPLPKTEPSMRGRKPVPAAAKQKPLDAVLSAGGKLQQREVIPAGKEPKKMSSVYGEIRVPSAASPKPADGVLPGGHTLQPPIEFSPVDVPPPAAELQPMNAAPADPELPPAKE